MPRFSITIIVFSFASFFTQCSKAKKSCESYNPPSSLFFQIKNNGGIVDSSILNKTRLSYFQNGVKVYVADWGPATDFYADKGILTSRTIGTFENQVFYLEYPNDYNTDTLNVQNALPTQSTNCEYVVKEIKYNGQIVHPDTSFGYQPVYILNKQ